MSLQHEKQEGHNEDKIHTVKRKVDEWRLKWAGLHQESVLNWRKMSSEALQALLRQFNRVFFSGEGSNQSSV